MNLGQNIISFYKNSNKPTFWFTVVIISRLFAFLPNVPSIIVYLSFFLYACYVLTRSVNSLYIPLVIFIAYIPIQLLATHPDSMFHSWERFILFILLLVCVSPLFISTKLINCRKTIFYLVAVCCSIVGVGSFFARFLGINYGSRNQIDFILNVGSFGGLTSHSMLLGPTAGIGALFCLWLGFTNTQKKYRWWTMAVFCAISVLFSASRSSLMALIAGMAVLIYKLSETKTKFLKIIITIVIMGTITFPIWGSALDSVIKKNELNVASGSAFSSRDALWQARILEFKENPVFGVGFGAIDLDIASEVGGYDETTGMVESGSSWLIILSMTGIIGLILLLPVLFVSYKSAFSSRDSLSSLICGVLTLFYVHMIAEGYIFYGGSLLAFMLWATVGAASDYKYSSATSIQ